MIRTRRLAAALSVAAAAATMFTAGPALADSGPPQPPSSDPTAMFCPVDLQRGQTIQEADGSLLFCDEALGAGAVVAVSRNGGIFVDQVIVAPGWTFEDASGGGSGKVDVKFENPTTRHRVEVRIEPGKTDIRGS